MKPELKLSPEELHELRMETAVTEAQYAMAVFDQLPLELRTAVNNAPVGVGHAAIEQLLDVYLAFGVDYARTILNARIQQHLMESRRSKK